MSLRQSLAEHAEAQRLSINTVRSQLRSATLRVGVKRQAELVRMVLTEVLLPDRALPEEGRTMTAARAAAKR